MRLLITLLLLFAFLTSCQAAQPETAGRSSAAANPRYELTTTDEEIARLERKLELFPEDAATYAGLGLLFLQRARESGDAAFYGLAENALTEALAYDEHEQSAILGMGVLTAAQHDFDAALQWSHLGQELNPHRAALLGIEVDALVELGRYQEAVEVADRMAAMSPGLSAYSRISYMRELHGDVDGAIDAMDAAANAGIPGSEEWLWTVTQLGTLYFNKGDWQTARETYDVALTQQPDYPFAEAGVAAVLAAQGDLEGAEAILAPLVARFPLPQVALQLADVQRARGFPDKAAGQYDLVRVVQQLNQSSGMNVDMELAIFEAEHGDADLALQLARDSYDRGNSIWTADALAWALFHQQRFDEAWEYAQEALRLGTRAAQFHYHAGMIAAHRGDVVNGCAHLETALEINPGFSISAARAAEDTLAQLSCGS